MQDDRIIDLAKQRDCPDYKSFIRQIHLANLQSETIVLGLKTDLTNQLQENEAVAMGGV